MPNRGDTVYFNETNDPDIPAWTVGQVMMTDTDPTADEIAAILTDAGDYPTQPTTGQVLITFYNLWGNESPSLNYAYASEGTDPGQYSTTLPS